MIIKEEYAKIFPKIDLEKVLDNYNINYKIMSGSNGTEYMMRCPLPGHDDKNPSFCLNRKTGMYNCFVCGGGNFFKFIMKMEKLQTLEETVTLIKNKLGLVDGSAFTFIEHPFFSLTQKINRKVNRQIDFKEITLPQTEPAEDFFDIVKKRVDLQTIKKWGLRYCVHDDKFKGKYDGRLIIPIYYNGKLISFAARDMLNRAEKWKEILLKAEEQKLSQQKIDLLALKYEVKKILYPYGAPVGYIFYNWDEAIKKDHVILCEGIFDVFRVINYGYNAMALLSCNLNNYRANLLRKNFKTIYVALDNDDKINKKGVRINPGQEHAIKILKERLNGIETYNIVLPFGKDPDDCTKEEFDQSFNAAKNFFKIW